MQKLYASLCVGLRIVQAVTLRLRIEKDGCSKETRIISSWNCQAKHILDLMALSPRVGESFDSIRRYIYLSNALDTIDGLAKTPEAIVSIKNSRALDAFGTIAESSR